MKRESCVFYTSWIEAMEGWPIEEQKDAVYAIILYATTGKIVEDEKMGIYAKTMLKVAIPQIDANNKKYRSGKKGADYGKLGGAPAGNKNAQKNNPKTTPKQPQNNPNGNPKTTPNVNENVNENDIKEIIKEKPAPKVAAIRANKDEMSISSVPIEWQPIVSVWLDYKRTRRESYKSAASVAAFQNKLVQLSGGDLNVAAQIINQSIAMNWAGIFSLKTDKNYANNPTTMRRTPASRIGVLQYEGENTPADRSL